VAHDHGPLQPQLDEGPAQKLRLRRGRPELAGGPVAVAVAGPIERHDPERLGGTIEHTAPDIVVSTDDIAVQQDHGRAGPALEIVDPRAVDLQEPAHRRMIALGLACPDGVPDSSRSERSRADRDGLPGFARRYRRDDPFNGRLCG
jgi:hypothetical protein